MMKKEKRLYAALAALILCLALSACDYIDHAVPAEPAETDIPEYDIPQTEETLPDGTEETVQSIISGVSSQITSGMDHTVDALHNSGAPSLTHPAAEETGVTGTWKTKVDISSLICGRFSALTELELDKYIKDITVTAELRFTDDGIYLLRFDRSELSNARETILSSSVKAVNAFLAKQGGAAKLVIKAIDEQTVSGALSYVVDMELDLVKNGAAGEYWTENNTITFEDCGRCTYRLGDNSLTLSGSTLDGMLSAITDAIFIKIP